MNFRKNINFFFNLFFIYIKKLKEILIIFLFKIIILFFFESRTYHIE
jgi:hypothetical protein